MTTTPIRITADVEVQGNTTLLALVQCIIVANEKDQLS
jgi:hypothetical protein